MKNINDFRMELIEEHERHMQKLNETAPLFARAFFSESNKCRIIEDEDNVTFGKILVCD